ncbi:MAG TPA: hypothetical protein VEA81_12345 [Burkholderiaceae bacterium]|nr:hypothetical protein [Burkholderiaceae bacterium]
MTVDAILFLQPSDLLHFAATRERWPRVPRLFVDPGLVERAASMQLDVQPFEFRPPEVGPHFQARAATEAATRAAALDVALTAHREALFGPGLLCGWDQGLMRQFFVRVLVAAHLGRACERDFPEARIGLFRPRNAQQFYFDGRPTTEAFAGGSERWVVLDEYDAGEHHRPDAWTDVLDPDALRAAVARDRPRAVVHVPTTYRHVHEYREQILQAFDRPLDVPSPFWDIPIHRPEPLSRPLGTGPRAAWHDACVAYRERARATLVEHLRPVIPDEGTLRRQAELFARRCEVQAHDFHALGEALEGHAPRFVVTDHDTGSNGPLFSVAARLDAPVTVLPHSSYATGAIPHARRVEVVERDGFATPVRSVWGEAVACRGVALGPRVERRPRTGLRTVCMLVNGMVSNGLFHIDFVGTVAFHESLQRLCALHGLRLVLRLKPTAPGLRLFAAATGTSAERLEALMRPPLEAVAAESDVCVSFGQPTTGTISFLAAGCYLMHASRMPWPIDPAFSPAYFADGTVPCMTPDDALAHLLDLVESPEAFGRRAARQHEAFGRRLSGGGRIFDASGPR